MARPLANLRLKNIDFIPEKHVIDVLNLPLGTIAWFNIGRDKRCSHNAIFFPQNLSFFHLTFIGRNLLTL